MALSTPTKGIAKSKSLVVCACTVTGCSVDDMGAGFKVFKALFRAEQQWQA